MENEFAVGHVVSWKGANRVETGRILEITGDKAYVSTRDGKGVVLGRKSIIKTPQGEE